MAISTRSNRSLWRFWARVVVTTYCALVLAGLLGLPVHKGDKLTPGTTDAGVAQPARSPDARGSTFASVGAIAPIPARNSEIASARSQTSGTSLSGVISPQPQGAVATKARVVAVRITLPPDVSMTREGISGRDQRNTTLAMTQLTKLDAEIERRTRDLETLAVKRDQLQSQIDHLSGKLVEASQHVAGMQGELSQTNKSTVATHIPVPQVFRPAPYREISSAPLQRGTRREASPVEQLLLARKALVNNDSPAARDLLEAAQTSIVFAPGNTAPESAGIAAAQIADALTMLNTGDPGRALPYLNRAITMVHPRL